MNSKRPLVSVIIPVYKVESYLDRCVKSLVDQTYKELEIILVDDGSPDNCPEMCDTWAAKDARIRVIHKTNGGVSTARNAGIDICTGEYIVFIDGDDTVSTSLIEILVEESMYGAVVLAGFDRMDQQDEEKKWEKNLPRKIVEKPSVHSFSRLRSGLYCTGALFPAGVICQSPLIRFDQNLNNLEDAVWICCVLCRLTKAIYIDIPLYHYSIRADSVSVKCVDAKWQAGSWVKARQSIKEYKKSSGKKSKQEARILRQANLHCLKNFYSECFAGGVSSKEIRLLGRRPLIELVVFRIAMWIKNRV